MDLLKEYAGSGFGLDFSGFTFFLDLIFFFFGFFKTNKLKFFLDDVACNIIILVATKLKVCQQCTLLATKAFFVSELIVKTKLITN